MAGGFVDVPNVVVGDSKRTVRYWSSTGDLSPAAVLSPAYVPYTPGGASLPSVVYSGSTAVGTGTTLPPHPLVAGNVVCHAPLTNTAAVQVGAPGSPFQLLEPGTFTSVRVGDTSDIGINGTVATDAVSWLAS